MRITVRLLANYRSYLPAAHDEQGGFVLETEPGTTARDVLASLAIPPAECCTFFVNGRHGRRDQVLEDGDALTVFPAVGGG